MPDEDYNLLTNQNVNPVYFLIVFSITKVRKPDN